LVYKRFVRTSETQDKRQPDLFDEAGEKDETGKEDEAEKETIPYQRNKHKAGRKPLPENLTREEHINDLPEEEKTCSCGARLKRIGENVNEKLIIEEPGIYAERTVTPKRNGTRTTYNKKGSPENPRLRVTMPSDLTLKRLAEYIAADMFIPGGDHVNRLEQLGRYYDKETLLDGRRFILLIIKEWGTRTLASIDPTEITTHHFDKNRSGQWKNRYKKIFSEIYDEAKWQKLKIPKPKFDSFAVKPQKADVLTTEELKRLFLPENFRLPKMGHDGSVFYTMFLLCLSGGLRLGEVRAVRRKQVFFERKALLIDGFCKRNGTRTTYNKKGSPENPRLRVTMPSDLALKKLAEYMAAHPCNENDFIFWANCLRERNAKILFFFFLFGRSPNRRRRFFWELFDTLVASLFEMLKNGVEWLFMR
jgi:hypothetical protein